MSERIHFSPLGSADSAKIRRLQKKLFPRALTEPEQEIRQILLNTEEHMVCNLSYGMFDGTRMVGYVFAYVEDKSLVHRRSEEVLYIKEIALMPGYERYLRQIFQRLFAQWVVFTPNIPVEAHAQAESLANWRRLTRVFRFYGLTMTSIDGMGEDARAGYKLLRLDVAGTTVALADQSIALPQSGWSFRDDITVSVVTDARQWLSLKKDWEALLRSTADSNVFQSFEYLWEWWKHFGIWNDLRVMVIRRGAAVIGAAPLMLEYFPVFGRIVRKLSFISAPMEMNRPKLLFGKDPDICLDALLAYLEHDASSWEVIDIDEQLRNAQADKLRRHFATAGYLVTESATTCPYIDVQGTWDQYLGKLSRKMRGNVNRLRRRVESEGAVSIRTVNSWPELEAALDLHCELEERSWKADQNLGIASNKAHYFFYRGLAQAFGREGSFALRILECGGKPLASTFGIDRGNFFQSLKIAHDSEYDKMSPGTVLESYELEQLFQKGIARYEFMGSFLANKLRWTSTTHETINIHIYRRQPRLALFYFLFFVVKRQVSAVLKRTGQFDKVDKFLSRFKNNPFPRY